MVRLKRPFGKGRLLVAFVVACSLLGGKPCLFRDGGPICPTPPRKPSTLRAVFLYSPVRPGPVRTESGFNRFVGPCRPWQEEGSQESQKRREEATKNPQKHARNAAIAMAAFGAVAAVGVTVVVAGASGRVGKAVLESLRRLPGVDVVALARDGAKARAQTGTDGLSVLEADFADTAALAVAMECNELLSAKPWRLFLVCGNVPNQAKLEINVLEAAEKYGCEYVVRVSTVRTVLEAKSGGPYEAHLEVEAALAASPLQYTCLRPNVYMQMLPSGVLGIGHLLRSSDTCSHPFAATPVSLIDARDVAAVASRLLTLQDPSEYNGQVLDLTGPAAVSYRDVAEAVSEIRPRPVTCEHSAIESITDPMGLPAGVAKGFQAFFTTLSQSDFITDTVSQVSGRPPRTISAFVRDHASAFLPAQFSRLVAKSRGSSFRAEATVASADTAETLAAMTSKQLFVKVLAAGVNGGADTLQVTGSLDGETDLGFDGVGLVIATGPDVDEFEPGDRVAFVGAAYAEYTVANVSVCWQVPSGSAPEEVAALRISGLTALVALERTAKIMAGDTVLVTAACGATGSFAVQLAKLAGATVIGTVGSEEKRKVAEDLGCDRVVNYNQEDLSAVLGREFRKGLDIAYEGVGGALFRAAHDNLAEGGRILLVGS